MTEYIDVNSITKIKFLPLREDVSFYWVESKPITHFWGLYNTGNFTKSGFGNSCSWGNRLSSIEEIKSLSSCIVDEQTKIVYSKPYVQIILKHDLSISKIFENDSDAQNWIDHLRRISTCKIEII